MPRAERHNVLGLRSHRVSVVRTAAGRKRRPGRHRLGRLLSPYVPQVVTEPEMDVIVPIVPLFWLLGDTALSCVSNFAPFDASKSRCHRGAEGGNESSPGIFPCRGHAVLNDRNRRRHVTIAPAHEAGQVTLQSSTDAANRCGRVSYSERP